MLANIRRFFRARNLPNEKRTANPARRGAARLTSAG
jgi:hypothetical protein